MAKNKKTTWYIGGLHFQCDQCGDCCSGPNEGYIWLTRKEVDFIADFLKTPPGKFRGEHTKRIGLRTTLIEQPYTKDCTFLREIDGRERCMIYPVRPNQCRTWPFWPGNLTNPAAWNKAGQRCGGINRGRLYSFEEIQRIKKQKKWWQEKPKK